MAEADMVQGNDTFSTATDGNHGVSQCHRRCSKNSPVRTRAGRNGFTSDTMLARSQNRTGHRRVAGGCRPEISATDPKCKVKLKANHTKPHGRGRKR